MDGFDHYAMGPNQFHGWQTFGFTYDLTGGKLGTAGIRNGSNATAFDHSTFVNTDNSFIFGWSFAPETNGPLDRRPWISFTNSGGSNHIVLTIEQIPAGAVSIRQTSTSGTLIAQTAPLMFALGVEAYWEFKVLVDDTVGTVELRRNGIVVASATGVDTKVPGNAPIVDMRIFGMTNMAAVYDNFYALNTLGTENNDFLGPSHILNLRPDEDGTPQDWALSAGTDVFALLDDPVVDNLGNPYFWNDGNDSYIESSVSGDKAVVGFQDLSADREVFALELLSFSHRQTASTTTHRRGLISGAVDEPEADSEVINNPSFFVPVTKIYELDPDGNVPWTQAKINALQAYVENRSALGIRTTKIDTQVLQSLVPTGGPEGFIGWGIPI